MPNRLSDRSVRRLRWYRQLLKLFPRAFRERWGSDMESVCQYRLAAAGDGAWPSTRAWLGILADALTGAAREWIRHAAARMGIQGGFVGSASADLRQALRGLQKTPGASGIAVLTLALGIGAVTTTFSVVNAVVLEPLPFEDPDRLVTVWPVANFNTALVREVAQGAPALSGVAGISTWTAVLSGVGDPQEVDVGRVSPEFFSILGVRPALGRVLLPDEDRIDDAAVVVLSHDLWSTRFGSAPDIVGRGIRLNVDTFDMHTVVGVMPRDFRPAQEVHAWVPLIEDPTLGVADDSSWFVNDRIARLAPGATVGQASQQIAALARRFAEQVPNQFGPEQVAAASVVPLKQDLIESAAAALWILLGAVGLVLLIACANVANLLLARGEARRHSLAIRASLGATRASILRFLLTETLLLGLVGGLLGFGTALVLTDIVVTLAPADIPRIDQVDVSWPVLLFALVVTLGATLVAGLWPAIRTSRGGLFVELGGSSRGSSGRGTSRVVSHTLIGAEMALAVVVTLGSGLMLRSLDQLLSANVGFEPEGVVAFRPNPLGSGRVGAEEYRAFYSQLLEQVAEAPGVRSAGAVQILTGTPNNWSFPTFPEDVEIPENEGAPNVNFRAVMPGYFETLGIPVLRGRTIQSVDRADTEPVVVVNRSFVERFWPGQEALGKTLSILSTDATQLRVVGVVGDIRQHGLSRDPRPELYVPFVSWPWEMSAWMVARTDAPEQFKMAVRGIVDRVDPSIPVSGIDDLDSVIERSAAETRFFTILLSGFGLLGLVLGAVGIYGVTAYTVVRRRAEFGVRIALGATRGDVIRSALRHGVAPVVLGALLGVGMGVAGGRLLRSYLYQVEPFDPPTVLAVATMLALVASVALVVPAWRAGRVDPIEVLSAS